MLQAMAKDLQRKHFEGTTSFKVVDLLSSIDDPQFDEAGIFVTSPRNVPNVKGEDIFGGWDVVNLPIYHTEPEGGSPKKKHSDLLSGYYSGEGAKNHVANNINNAKLYSKNVKAGIEYSNAEIWKTCVEPTTYRYIPNNGRYRSSKAIVPKLNIQKPVKRLAEAKLNSEQRKLQKEIQRELRKEFEQNERDHNGKKKESDVRFTRSPSPLADDWGEEEGAQIKVKVDIVTKQQQSTSPINPPNSPVLLPPIAIPLAANEPQPSKRFDVFREISNRENVEMQLRRSRQDDLSSKYSRSRSEPPHPGSRTTHSNREQDHKVDFELGPTKLFRESSSGTFNGIHKMIKGHRRKPERLERLITTHDCSWTSNPNLLTEGSHLDMYYGHQKRTEEYVSNSREKTLIFENEEKPRKSSFSSRKNDVSPTSSSGPMLMTQIKYMAASGEVSKIPKFGRTGSDLDSPDDYYSSIEKESPQHVNVLQQEENVHVKSTMDKLKNVMTTKFINPIAVKQELQELPMPKFKPQKLKGTHLFTDSNSTKLVTGGFRGVPLTQVKLPDKIKQTIQTRPMELNILPQIAGRKVNMAATSHRIV